MDFFKNLERSISAPRLAGYKQKPGTDEEMLARYLWNIALCESLYPLVQILEVAFRNAVHSELETFLGADWLKASPKILYPPEKERIAEAGAYLQKASKPITEAGLIAELSFGFWTSLLDVRYDRMWHRIIAKVFPEMPRNIRTRQEASSRMSTARKLRNSALHHHSIWHWSDLEKQHAETLILIGWICPASAKIAQAINRFPEVYARGSATFFRIVRTIS